MSESDDPTARGDESSSSEPMMRCSRCEKAMPVAQAIEAPVGYQCRECAKGAVPARRLADAMNAAPITRGIVYTIGALFIVSLAIPDLTTMFGLRPILVGPEGPTLLDAIASWYSATPVAQAIGEPWRLLTSAFLHANFMHIGFNGLLLWQLGHLLEPRLGRGRYIALYAAGLAGGSLGVVALALLGSVLGETGGFFGNMLGGNPFQITIGASGAVFGLMGAAMIALRDQGINPWRSSIGTLVLINLAITFVIPQISVGGHVGGLLGGWLAARLLFVPREEAPRAVRIVSALVAAMLIVAIVLAAMIVPAVGG